MGVAQVTVAVTIPTDPQHRWEGLFLVDAGAVDCYVPAKHLRALGIESMGKRTFGLADGTEVAMDIGVARIAIMGEAVGATVILATMMPSPCSGSPHWNPLVSKSTLRTSDSRDYPRCG